MTAQARRRIDESGTAVVEFVWLAMLVMLPLVYVVIAVMRVQAAAFAVTEASRAAGRAYVQADSTAVGLARARVAADVALRDQGFVLTKATLRVTCRLGACLTPGSVVDVRISLAVSLPLLPKVLKGATASSISVAATHTQRVDVYRRWP
jgi:Flp pilus assembly protein TadG